MLAAGAADVDAPAAGGRRVAADRAGDQGRRARYYRARRRSEAVLPLIVQSLRSIVVPLRFHTPPPGLSLELPLIVQPVKYSRTAR